ncbi:hypothetical protein PR202_ga25232 [Eleusine coracana subsp. coracana]|uniref:Uncharacterized protein n=1 Tax=Eleusine coracana subsp. coracana TaxID=191504 RepID=A0AAV5DB39_ELECO|nr:hypothetical protein PR202_ga25232 [Eleusine coracana subsp. coracana]
MNGGTDASSAPPSPAPRPAPRPVVRRELRISAAAVCEQPRGVLDCREGECGRGSELQQRSRVVWKLSGVVSQ